MVHTPSLCAKLTTPAGDARQIAWRVRGTSPSSPAEETGTLKVLQREFKSHLGYHHRDIAQFGRAPSLGGGCRRFESCYPDHAGLAQWIERRFCKADDLGSNPRFGLIS